MILEFLNILPWKCDKCRLLLLVKCSIDERFTILNKKKIQLNEKFPYSIGIP